MANGVEPVHRIAVITPMLNEAAHVADLVEDLAGQDFGGEVQVFVADGGSDDGSRDALRRAAERAGLRLTVLDNSRRVAAAGLNVCLRAALPTSPDLIVRLDCHARYPADYLRQCARVSEETGAWNVGGLFVPLPRTATERAIACALESPFGGHNWMRNRHRRVEADTVFCGAFRPEAFERVGLYDETVGVAEVEDLNTRIRLAGGRVVYDPAIWLSYIPRGTFRKQFVQYYRYGLWKVAVTRKHRRVLSARALVPLLFAGSLAVLGAAAPFSRSARLLLAAEVALYAAAALVFGVAVLRRRSEPWSLLPRVVAVFPTLHLAHGLGGIHGWVIAFAGRFRFSTMGPRSSKNGSYDS